MASKYSIEAVFKLLDGVSGPLGKISKSTKGFSAGFERDVQKAELKWKKFGSTMKSVGKAAVVGGIAAVGAGFVDSTKKYIDFEDSIIKAGSKFKDLDVTSATYANDLETLQTAAREVGAATKYSATDAAGALDKMAMAGMSSKQSMALLMGTTNLATAAGTDLTSAVDMATDALGAFGFAKAAGDDEQALAGYLDRVSDVVAKTTNMANTDMSMWFEAVKNGASNFTSMGGTLEEFSGMVGILANAGTKGGEAGTALRNIMLNLGAPSSTARKALDELGIQVYDTEGKMLPIIDILEQFEGALGDVDEQTKNAALENIFGKRNVNSFQILMAAGTDQIKEYVTTLKNSGGTAEAIARAQEKSLKSQIAVLKSAFEDKQLSFGKAFAENGGSAGLQKLIEMVQNFDPAPVINLMIGVLNRLPAIINFVGGLVKTLWNFRSIIIGIVGAYATYKAAVMAAAAQQMIMNAIMDVNPVGLIIVAVGALIAGIVALVTHLDVVKEAFNKVWTAVSQFFEPVGRFIDKIKTAFTDGTVLNGIKAIGNAILGWVLTPLEGMLNLLSNIPGIGKYIGMGADKIADLRASLSGGATAAPVTAGERVAYSREETVNTLDVNIGTQKGLTASVSGTAPGVNVKTTKSSAY